MSNLCGSEGVSMCRGKNMSRNLEKCSQSNTRLEGELELLLLEQQLQKQQRTRNLLIERENDLNMCRSGSAPPTVEGAVSSVGSLFRVSNSSQFTNNGTMTEEEIRSHPTYLAYYYSNENKNPRLPPPLLSREDWRVAQRVGSSFGGNDWRNNNNVADCDGRSSLFSSQPTHKADNELMLLRKVTNNNILRRSSPNLVDQSMFDMAGVDMGSRTKSFADTLQDGSGQHSVVGHLSRPSSSNSFCGRVATSGVLDARSSNLQARASTNDVLHPGKLFPRGLSIGQNPLLSDTFASSMNLPSAKDRPLDPLLVGNITGNVLPSVPSRAVLGEVSGTNSVNGFSSDASNIADVAASLSALSMANNQLHRKDEHLHCQIRHPQFQKGAPNAYLERSRSETGNYAELIKETIDNSRHDFDGNQRLRRKAFSYANMQSQVDHPDFACMEEWNSYNLCNNNDDAGLAFQRTLINARMKRNEGQGDSNIDPALLDPQHVHQLLETYNQHKNTGPGHGNPAQMRTNPGIGDLHDMKMMHLETLHKQQKLQCQSCIYNSSGLHNHMGRSSHPSAGTGTVMYQNQRIPFECSIGKKSSNAGTWNSKAETSMEGPTSTLLEELKNNSRSLELPDVMGYVREFSMDQYGSRFIQQQLVTVNSEGKIKIFSEIMPCARSLMTDVFGNYVIQKFFEHGSETQRKELASQLIGHVLPLSIHMYGCRVIQKALEVIDVEQKTEMVKELDGSVMKCIHDQNGNHVIQKCIEFVPADRIQFIISSFFGQVVSLSMHPYGCRVIQRVLEHCNDPVTQNLIMDEIMQSICNLAQDQYGNYVIQHVLQHGKSYERSAIISKLAGQIVKMSQHKYASNVVEKCLTFGSPGERQILVIEMLGSTDENAPLQAMMKDPFGNYVVQKILDTCDNKSRELILSRIKVHLNSLKRYTYGKHVVSRVEKLLITAGERHRSNES